MCCSHRHPEQGTPRAGEWGEGPGVFRALFFASVSDVTFAKEVLLAKVNEWVEANIKNGKLNAIYKKYYGTDLPEDMRGN